MATAKWVRWVIALAVWGGDYILVQAALEAAAAEDDYDAG